MNMQIYYQFNIAMLLIGAFGILEWLSRIFNDVFVYLGYYLPYLMPYIIVFLPYNALVNKYRNDIVYMNVLYLYMASILMWIIISIYNNYINNIEFHSMVVLSNLWVLLIFMASKSFSLDKLDYRKTLIKSILFVIFFIGCIQVLFELVLLNIFHGLISESLLVQNNVLTMIFVFGISILLVEYRNIDMKKTIMFFYGLLFLAIIFLEEARGAAIIVTVISLVKVMLMLKNHKHKMRIAILALGVGFMVMLVLQSSVINLFNSLAYGVKTEALPKDIRFIEGEKISIFIRYNTVRKAALGWLEKPMLGVGQSSLGSKKYTVMGYQMHSHLTFILFGYGVLGFLPFFLMLAYIVYAKKDSSIENYIYIIVLLSSMMNIDDAPQWLGLLLFLFYSSPSKNIDISNSKPKQLYVMG